MDHEELSARPAEVMNAMRSRSDRLLAEIDLTYPRKTDVNFANDSWASPCFVMRMNQRTSRQLVDNNELIQLLRFMENPRVGSLITPLPMELIAKSPGVT